MLLYMTYTGNVKFELVAAALICLAGPTSIRVYQLRQQSKDLVRMITADRAGRDSSSPPD